jgi:hypothetical protein
MARKEDDATAGRWYDGIPEDAKVGGVWGAMRCAARDARAEGAAARTVEVVAKLRALSDEQYVSAGHLQDTGNARLEHIYRERASTLARAANIIERAFPPATPPTKEPKP